MNLIRNIFKSIFSKKKPEVRPEPKTESFKMETPKRRAGVLTPFRPKHVHPLRRQHQGTFSPLKSL